MHVSMPGKRALGKADNWFQYLTQVSISQLCRFVYCNRFCGIFKSVKTHDFDTPIACDRTIPFWFENRAEEVR